MRHLILDTETTGLDPKLGHRLIEIAAVEVVDRRLTGRSVHFYVNPEREIDGGATDVHGLTWEMLRDKPRFADIAGEFIDFARGARWVIHNAAFDLAFLDAELERLQLSSTAGICESVIDTLALAREQFPGKKNSLDRRGLPGADSRTGEPGHRARDPDVGGNRRRDPCAAAGARACAVGRRAGLPSRVPGRRRPRGQGALRLARARG